MVILLFYQKSIVVWVGSLVANQFTIAFWPPPLDLPGRLLLRLLFCLLNLFQLLIHQLHVQLLRGQEKLLVWSFDFFHFLFLLGLWLLLNFLFLFRFDFWCFYLSFFFLDFFLQWATGTWSQLLFRHLVLLENILNVSQLHDEELRSILKGGHCEGVWTFLLAFEVKHSPVYLVWTNKHLGTVVKVELVNAANKLQD